MRIPRSCWIHASGAAVLAVAALLFAAAVPAGVAPALASEARRAANDGKQAIASVNGEPVTLDDLLLQIGAVHAGVAETRTRRPDPSDLLNRVIQARLILQEARRMGIDRQPEVEAKVEQLRVGLIKSRLVGDRVDRITEGDPAAVERLYRDAVRVVTVDSLLFQKEQDAESFSAAIRKGGDFAALARKAVADGAARGGAGPQDMKHAELQPAVAQALAAMKPGEVGAPVRLAEGMTIVRLVDVRYPEDREARRQAEQDALEARKQASLSAYTDLLRSRYTSVDRRVLQTLDFQAKSPGLEALRKDERVVARVKGGAPVRVKDLTAAVEAKYYHGVEGAIERKRVNEDLPQILDRILVERATLLEAKRLGLERTESFRAALKQKADGALFEAFVARVINPEVKLDSPELRKHYDEHREAYTTPEMMRIESLAFLRYADAQAAIETIRKGGDLKWVRTNAEGQAGPESFASLVRLDGDLVAVAALPATMRKAVAGARAGDCRFSGEPGGPFYVLSITQVVPAAPRPYDAVKGDIATELFVIKRKAAVDDWAVKLRAASDVRIFASGEDLSRLLGLGSTKGA